VKFADPIVVGLIVVAGLTTALRPNSCAAQTEPDIDSNRKRIEQLSPSAKRELEKKKKHFDQMSEDEKARLRRLDAEIRQHAQAAEIRRVLERYGQWLATLTATERAELQELKPDARLTRIRELRQGEQNRRLSKCGLTPADANKVYQWWDRFADENPDRLVELMDDGERRAYEEMDQDDPRRVFIMRGSVWRSLDRLLASAPPDTTNNLIDQLSDEVRERYRDLRSSDDKNELLERWIRESIHYRMRPAPASEADLRRMVERLPRDERGELERLRPDEVERILRERWENQQTWRRMGSQRGFHRRFDEGRGPRDRDRDSRGKHDDDREHGDRSDRRGDRRHDDRPRERPESDEQRNGKSAPEPQKLLLEDHPPNDDSPNRDRDRGAY
jgi:hypothetical protein